MSVLDKNVPRYHPEQKGIGYSTYAIMENTDNGEYVKYEDYVKLANELLKAIDSLGLSQVIVKGYLRLIQHLTETGRMEEFPDLVKEVESSITTTEGVLNDLYNS